MTRPQDRYQRFGLVLVVLGLALIVVSVPAAAVVLVLAGVCFVAAVRGWRFPGLRPEPEQRLSRKARRYVEVDPEWSVDFLPPVVSHLVPDPIPFSGVVPEWTRFGTILARNAGRSPGVDLADVGVELSFFRDDGKLVYDRIPARWSNNPFPELRQQLPPEVRRLPATGVEEPIDVVARTDDHAAAYVHTSDAARGGKRLPLEPALYHVRVQLTCPDDDPFAWYRVRVPLMAGLELSGPGKPPPWAPPPRPRRAPPAPKVAPRKRFRSSG